MTYVNQPPQGHGYMQQPPPPPPRRGGAGWKIFAALMTVLLVLSVVGNLVLFLFVMVLGAGANVSEGPARHVEAEVLKAGGGDKIAIVPVSGEVDDQMVERMVAFCEYVKKDSSIKGVVLEVDSPGGGITASDEIHHLVTNLKAGRKVVVSMRGLAASGGYYISAPADKIYAQRTTLTGSIGVIWPAFEVTELMKKVGVTPEIIKSDTAKDYKDAGSPFKQFTEKDREYIRGLVNNAQEKFSAVVDAGRTGKLKKPVKELAIGKIFTADEAKDLGLVDEIAYVDEVCDLTATELMISNPTIIRLKRRAGFFEALSAATPGGERKIEIHVDRKVLDEMMPRMEYRAPAIK